MSLLHLCFISKMSNVLSVCLVGPKVVYVPPPPPEEESSIFSQFATGINFDKYDDIPVEVSGSNAPKAIMVSYIDVYLALFFYFENHDWISAVWMCHIHRVVTWCSLLCFPAIHLSSPMDSWD